ncbi:MAG: capsular polysaccharide biosynthesis protein [Candidatus Omnitrophica bacterium]|nr:capsular polysaccharide biosynthesis protein [Candidatus Omnitrophota bacterium]
MIGILSRGIARISDLAEFLGDSLVFIEESSAPGCDKVVAWGLSPHSMRARRYARKHKIPFILLEDGFLRSVGFGQEEQPLSIVVDDRGIYYDSSKTSRLERLIAVPHSDVQLERAEKLMKLWRAERVSKYNYGREVNASLKHQGHPYVLVVDQILDDSSIRYGSASADSFQRMLQAALAENPDCTILIKSHPVVLAGRRQGHFDLSVLSRNSRIKVLREHAHPVSLIEHAKAVYVVTSQIGFEGILWGKKVRTFGMPFYAGWGLTEDELPAPDRRHPVLVEDLVFAALAAYPRYIHPETKKRCPPENLIEWMGLQRRMRERFPVKIDALNFQYWKKPIIQDFFQGSVVRFIPGSTTWPLARKLNASWFIKIWNSFFPSKEGDAVMVVWGGKPFDFPFSHERKKKTKIVRVEDGFLRSVGLGVNHVRPLSWVIDTRGIYYDPTQVSDLEHILQTYTFDEVLLKRAKALRLRLVEAGLSKYNISTESWRRPQNVDRKVILVPGQVETDMSLVYGAPDVSRNLDLLHTVREANPQAYIIYKPHPDVVIGFHKKGPGEDYVAHHCDEVVKDVSVGRLLMEIDEVHTITSQTGFEALLRGKKVVCYGQPFYSSWGLTDDKIPVDRRTRKLFLDELVAGALILYPTYVSHTNNRFTTPERAVDELLSWRVRGTEMLEQ